MKIKAIIVLFILNFSGNLVAQSYVQLNNFWENTYFINPASINNQYQVELKMSGRQQWATLEGAPTTYFGSATLFQKEKNTQFGLKMGQDNIGYTSLSNIDLTYAYSLKLKYDVNLHFGLALNYQKLSNDISKLKIGVSEERVFNIISENEERENFNSGIGLELESRKVKIGVSSQNVFSIIIPKKTITLNANYIYLMYRQSTYNNNIDLGFGMVGVKIGNITQMQLNATSYFNIAGESNPFSIGGERNATVFQLGVFYRTMSEVGAVFGIDLGNDVFLAYSCDFNLGGISLSSLGTHEVMLTYKINKITSCKDCWNR